MGRKGKSKVVPAVRVTARIVLTAGLALVLAVIGCLPYGVAAGAPKETAVLTRKLIQLEVPVKSVGNPSKISDFIDPDGVYTIAYASDTKVYISHLNDKLEIADTITIKKPMPKIGGVCCDQKGNFYIACGQEDTEGVLGSMVTVAVYQYSPSGKLLGKCEKDYRNRVYKNVLGETMLEENWETARDPFHSGNCAMAFRGDLLICSYGREMYNGHQSNGVFCVDTTTMKQTNEYDSYVSHSFNQAVLVTKGLAPQAKEGTVIFADHGDAYPRGMSVHIMQDPELREVDDVMPEMEEAVPFHFYGELGDNTTYASLAGIGELDKGIVLVGSSVKSMTADACEENRQAFLQLLDAATGKSLLSAASRSGTSGGDACTDEGIVWLTNYKKDYVGNMAMAVIDTDKVLVMWERMGEVNGFTQQINSYYSIIRSDGKVLKKAIPMQCAELNGKEELKYQDGYVIWTCPCFDEGEREVAVYRMKVWETTDKQFLNAAVTLDENIVWNRVASYTGKAIKPAVTVTYEGKKLKEGKDYTVSYKNHKKIGTAQVKVKGKGSYKGTIVKEFQIVPPAVEGLKGSYSGGKVKLSWKKSKKADGYEVLAIHSVLEFPTAQYHGSIQTKLKQTVKTSYKEKLRKSENRTYYVRPYTEVKGERLYGDWMGPVLTIELK